MPWKLKKMNGKWHVVRRDTGADEGESETKRMAVKHLQALYANAPETAKGNDMKHTLKTIVKAQDASEITLDDLRQQVCALANSDSRFNQPATGANTNMKCGGIWCCDLLLDGTAFKAVISAADGKYYEVPLTVEDGEVTELGEGETEVVRKTVYVEATLCFNGVPVVKAAGTSDGAASGHATRKTGAADAASQAAHQASMEAVESQDEADHEQARNLHEKAAQAHKSAMMAHAKVGNADQASKHARAMAAHDACAEAHGEDDKEAQREAVDASLAALKDVVKAGVPGSGRRPGGGKQTYRGHIFAKPDKLLLGGATEVHSSHFDTKEDAEKWTEGMNDQENADPGRSHVTTHTGFKGATVPHLKGSNQPSHDLVHCRASGSALRADASPQWAQDQPVKFCYMPAGIHTIDAGFSGPITKGRPASIHLTVEVDPDRDAAVCQASAEELKREAPKQDLYGCYEHDEKKASVWARKVEAGIFTAGDDPVYGEPCILLAAEPSGDGAEDVNKRNWRSWSPSFATDAEYTKCKCSRCDDTIQACECEKPQFYFPPGVRGHEETPAHITGVDRILGTLTNKPAFRAMPPVKARQAANTVAAEDGAEDECEMPDKPSDAAVGKESDDVQAMHRKANFKSAVAEAADEHLPDGEGHGTKGGAHRDAMYSHQEAGYRAKGAAVKQYHQDAAAYHGEMAAQHAKVTSAAGLKELDTVFASLVKAEDKQGGHLVKKDGEDHLPTHTNGKPDHRLMGAAWAALHGGYRGNKYEGPDKAKAIAKLKALYASEKMETPAVGAVDTQSEIDSVLAAVTLPPSAETVLAGMTGRPKSAVDDIESAAELMRAVSGVAG